MAGAEPAGDDPLKRQRHLDDYRDKEGIELGPEKIEKNPGLRTLATLFEGAHFLDWSALSLLTKHRTHNLWSDSLAP